MRLGFGFDVVQNLLNAGFVADNAAVWLDAGGGVHVALAAGDEGDQHAVDLIHASTNIAHGFASLGVRRFEA